MAVKTEAGEPSTLGKAGCEPRLHQGWPETWASGEGTQLILQYKNSTEVIDLMMPPTHVLKCYGDKSKSNPNYMFDDLYRNFYNPEFYHEAYSTIVKTKGSMTPGADGATLDGMSEARIQNIINSMRDGTYQPTPARRVYIKKKNSNKKRPLGIPSTDDKMVQEIAHKLLNSIYEPGFSNCSHGFRPKRSCHTALESIKNTFTGVKWIVEGDIKACFDSFDHNVLIDILKRRISDGRFIDLVRKMLKAGYLEQWVYNATLTGTPQGSGVSPILANIYMTELDNFIADLGSKLCTSVKRRKETPQYRAAKYQVQKILRKLADKNCDREKLIQDLKRAQKHLTSTQYGVHDDPDFRRLLYNRYADDFIVGIIGSRRDAERIKMAIKDFLLGTLKLTLSEEKTKITHSGDLVRYLGYDFTVSRNQSTRRDKKGILKRPWSNKVMLYVPHDKWLGKLKEYEALKIINEQGQNEKWVALHRKKLICLPVREILEKFNAEIVGLYNFYCIAENVSVLNKFYYIMKGSMLRTLAAKYSISVKKVLKRFAPDGNVGVDYETKDGTKRREFYHDGFAKKEPSKENVEVVSEPCQQGKPNRLVKRMKGGLCEFCGGFTGTIIMHHVKSLKSLTGKDAFELLMMKKRRKSLALCPDCFEKTQASK
jgi:group II intron reverse transcriptase/maturase